MSRTHLTDRFRRRSRIGSTAFRSAISFYGHHPRVRGNCADCKRGELRIRAAGSSPAGGDLRERLQHIHTAHSIDDELDRLTTTLQLSQHQRREVKVLLQQHQDSIQSMLDGNPNATDEFLRKRIHSISDDTHREISALLSDRQLVFVQQMQAQMREEGSGRYIDSLRNR